MKTIFLLAGVPNGMGDIDNLIQIINEIEKITKSSNKNDEDIVVAPLLTINSNHNDLQGVTKRVKNLGIPYIISSADLLQKKDDEINTRDGFDRLEDLASEKSDMEDVFLGDGDYEKSISKALQRQGEFQFGVVAFPPSRGVIEFLANKAKVNDLGLWAMLEMGGYTMDGGQANRIVTSLVFDRELGDTGKWVESHGRRLDWGKGRQEPYTLKNSICKEVWTEKTDLGDEEAGFLSAQKDADHTKDYAPIRIFKDIKGLEKYKSSYLGVTEEKFTKEGMDCAKKILDSHFTVAGYFQDPAKAACFITLSAIIAPRSKPHGTIIHASMEALTKRYFIIEGMREYFTLINKHESLAILDSGDYNKIDELIRQYSSNKKHFFANGLLKTFQSKPFSTLLTDHCYANIEIITGDTEKEKIYCSIKGAKPDAQKTLRLLSIFIEKADDFRVIFGNSELLLPSGDNSLSDAVVMKRPFIFEAPYWKLRYLQRLVKLIEDGNLGNSPQPKAAIRVMKLIAERFTSSFALKKSPAKSLASALAATNVPFGSEREFALDSTDVTLFMNDFIEKMLPKHDETQDELIEQLKVVSSFLERYQWNYEGRKMLTRFIFSELAPSLTDEEPKMEPFKQGRGMLFASSPRSAKIGDKHGLTSDYESDIVKGVTDSRVVTINKPLL